MNTIVKRLPFALLSLAASLVMAPAQTNVAPTVVIVHAGMRPGTTFMDITFRVDDPDDATVKVRALAFKDGVRSFANVIRPVTFVEGTGDKIGDAIPANANHALAWDVGADWNIDLGNVKFEILAMDGRGLLSFDWITIPAAGGYPEATVSRNSPSSDEVSNALFWLYASGDPGLSVKDGILYDASNNSEFGGGPLGNLATPFVLKRMNVAVAEPEEVGPAVAARAAGTGTWFGANRPYSGLSVIVGWGSNTVGQTTHPVGLNGVIAIEANGVFAHSSFSLALKSDGTVVRTGFGSALFGMPSVVTGVTAIAAGAWISVALKSDGTVVGWGSTNFASPTPPTGLTGVTAIAAGNYHCLGLKSDGTVVGWGLNSSGQATPPTGLTGVTAIAGGDSHSLALKGDGTVVGWGRNSSGQATPPTGLTGVTAIAGGGSHSLALKSDGTVVGWGKNDYGQATPPAGLTGVIAIDACNTHSLALKGDGTVVGWGSALSTPPAGLPRISAISAAPWHNLGLSVKTP